MKLLFQNRGPIAKVCALMTLALSACGSPEAARESAPKATAEEPIIAGVDAKSASLNAVGSLVEIYRYTLESCSYGGSSAVGGKSGVTGTSMSTDSVTPVGPIAQRHGRLDRWANAGPIPIVKSVTTGIGGASSIGGSPPINVGGQKPVAGASSMGGSRAFGGTTGIATTCTTVEIVSYYPFCSGTLVGPTAVETAKHCVMDLDSSSLYTDVGFAVGPDASNPTAVYPIVDWEWETEVPGDPNSLLSDLGSDVGVAHLGSTVTGVTPMAIGTLNASDIGNRFTALGFGIQNNNSDDGTRKAGSLTLRGIGGNYADYLFGSLDGFLKGAQKMPDFAGLPDWELTEIYDELNLLPEYQAFLGGRPGDAQPCFGDSGGPMVAVRNGQRTVFGNVTSGLRSTRLICDWGAVFAVFGPATQAFLQNALAWVDPCGGVTVKGKCDGDLAIRCTNRLEGQRRLSETDCGLLGQTCGLDETATVACVDP